MSRNGDFVLKEGAVLVCDAHFSTRRPELLTLLRQLADGRIPATQLILLGDIFDLLFGPIPKTLERNREAIGLIDAIAMKIEVIYFEGNHDFRLSGVFGKGVRIVPIGQQPLRAEYGGKRLYLAHGDILTDAGYRCYTALIRNPVLLFVLRWVDALCGNRIIRWLDAYLERKEDCNDFTHFEAYVARRLEGTPYAEADLFIEGHYHQNRTFSVGKTAYINPGAFACNQRYFVVKSIQHPQLLHEERLGKETGC